MNTLKISLYLTVCAFVFTVMSCNTEDLDPTLAQNKAVEGSISSVADLEGVVLGSYDALTGTNYYGRDFIIHGEIRSDNTFANGTSGRFQTQATFEYIANTGLGVWTPAYQAIARANVVIATDITTLSGDQAFAKHVQGQAYCMRALAHYNLLQNYGQQHVGGTLGVPYVTTFLGEDLLPARGTIDDNVSMIMTDLQTAFDMMDDSFFDSSKESMSKYAAKAIESRVAVYFGMWDKAKSAAEAVINSNLYSIIPSDQYVTSFAQDGAANAIFELAFSELDNVGINGLGNIYRGDSYGDVEVLPNVEGIYDVGDVRADILGYEGDKLRNIGKYPDILGHDNVTVIRYEEVLLNYAEALLETNGDALTELNKLTAERGAAAYVGAVTKDDIIAERRKELLFEGFRFDDLMRTGKNIEKIDPEQNIVAPIPYGDYRLTFPIPRYEIDANSNMVQNEGF